MDTCTICLQRGHNAASCRSDTALFLSGSGPASAAPSTGASRKKTDSKPTNAKGQSDTSSFEQLSDRYFALVDESIKQLGTQEAVCRWLGLNKATLTYRRNNPHTIKREHVLAIETLLDRTARRSLLELEEKLHKINNAGQIQ